MTESNDNGFRGWCVVELMGHVTLAGYVSEFQIGGSALLRVDVPESKVGPAFSKIVQPSALYAITPVDEDTVQAMCAAKTFRPFDVWELRQAFEQHHQYRLEQQMPRIEEDVRRRIGSDPVEDPDFDEV